MLFVLKRRLSFKLITSLIEGSQIPDVTLCENDPGNLVKIRDLFAGKKGLLIGVPGLVHLFYLEYIYI